MCKVSGRTIEPGSAYDGQLMGAGMGGGVGLALSLSLIVATFVLWVAIVVGAVWVSGRKKGLALWGWVLGILLGWIGVIIMMVIPPSPESQRREALLTGFACPHCHEPVRHGASVCPHCGRDIEDGGRT